MMTRDFAQRTRSRVVEARRVLTQLRAANKEAVSQLTKINKQHASDRARLYNKLGEIADDLIEKLPEGIAESDIGRAYALKAEVDDLASAVEEVSLMESTLEDLGGQLGDALGEVYSTLKQAEAQLPRVDRLGTKLGV